LSSRHGRGRVFCVKIGVDIVIYRAKIGGFVLGNKVESSLSRKRQDSGSAKVWFIGLVTVILLVINGVEVNPGPQVEQD
jgi:hypothetical protein